jgi:hypothetical protein
MSDTSIVDLNSANEAIVGEARGRLMAGGPGAVHAATTLDRDGKTYDVLGEESLRDFAERRGLIP